MNRPSKSRNPPHLSFELFFTPQFFMIKKAQQKYAVRKLIVMMIKFVVLLPAVRQENERMMHDVLQAEILNRTQSSAALRWHRDTRRALGSITFDLRQRHRRNLSNPSQGYRPQALRPTRTQLRHQPLTSPPQSFANRWAQLRQASREP